MVPRWEGRVLLPERSRAVAPKTQTCSSAPTSGGEPMNAPQSMMRIADIKISDRVRKDMGDIEGLAADIAELGLLHPVPVRPDGTLIAGARRIAAHKLLGRDEIPVTVVDIAKIRRGEYSENMHRKDFAWSEAVDIKRAVEEEEKAAAKERQRAGGAAGGQASGKLSEASKGQSRDKIAKAVGKKATTLAKAEAVVAAAEADPEKFGHLVEDMDESDNVDRSFKQVKILKERAAYEARADNGARVGDLIAMAEAGQKFAVIYADPPWEFKVYSGKGKQRSAERHYDVSSLEAIKALPIEALAAKDCALLLWCVSPDLPGALEVIKAWGFEYVNIGFSWTKQNPNGEGLFMGLGYYTRANGEPCLLATRGSPMRLAMDVSQAILAPVGLHSARPEEVRARIMRLFAGPYLELFARRATPGWTSWGNEIEG